MRIISAYSEFKVVMGKIILYLLGFKEQATHPKVCCLFFSSLIFGANLIIFVFLAVFAVKLILGI